MKIFRSLFVLILFWRAHCFSMDTTDLLHAIDRQDPSAVISFFDQMDVISLEEAHELISDFYGYYIAQFGSEILNSEEYLQNLAYCKELYHSILEQHGFPLEGGLIHNKNKGSYKVLLCRKTKKGLEA